MTVPSLIAAASAITADTTLPLGLVYLILAAVITGTAAAVGIYYRLGALIQTVRGLMVNGWTLQDQTLWSSQMSQLNRELKMPDVRKIERTPAQD